MYIDTLPLKKIYIDSRDRTVDSKSASNFKYFKIELPNTVQMPDNTVFFVTDVSVPHVWKTIEEGFNDRLCLRCNTPFPPAPGSVGRHVIVSGGRQLYINTASRSYSSPDQWRYR